MNALLWINVLGFDLYLCDLLLVDRKCKFTSVFLYKNDRILFCKLRFFLLCIVYYTFDKNIVSDLKLTKHFGRKKNLVIINT